MTGHDKFMLKCDNTSFQVCITWNQEFPGCKRALCKMIQEKKKHQPGHFKFEFQLYHVVSYHV